MAMKYRMEISNWFGLTNGKYFNESPRYVDTTKGPGMTELPKPTLLSWIKKSPTILITTPNFVWASISLLLYYFVPYDLSPDSPAAIAPISYTFMAERLPLWTTLTLGYFSFWHISLYGFQLASRPFIANRTYNIAKVIHNIVWTTSGIIIWTLFENILCYLWATQRLAYVPDGESFTSLSGALRFIGVLMGIPLWRSIHFYFAHRFLHYTPLYQQVHSLHHRNTDVEPFSGLCMHPIEHLYYYSCIAPSLIFYCSPFAFVWNGVHLLLSPAASHSGFEDHFQSDIFHYLHHRYFECNYAGSDAAFLDIWFGTFKGSFADHPVDKDGPVQREDSKSTLWIRPTNEFLGYLALCSLCIAPWSYIAMRGDSVSEVVAGSVSSFVGFGPVLLATLMTYGVKRTAFAITTTSDIATTVVHICIGTLFCSVPITYLCWLTLASQST